MLFLHPYTLSISKTLSASQSHFRHLKYTSKISYTLSASLTHFLHPNTLKNFKSLSVSPLQYTFSISSTLSTSKMSFFIVSDTVPSSQIHFLPSYTLSRSQMDFQHSVCSEYLTKLLASQINFHDIRYPTNQFHHLNILAASQNILFASQVHYCHLRFILNISNMLSTF